MQSLLQNRKFYITKKKDVDCHTENDGNQHFLLFPKCSKEASFLWLLTLPIINSMPIINTEDQDQDCTIKNSLILSLTLYSLNTCFDASTINILKILLEKEKLLVTSNFPFTQNVFHSVRYLYPNLSIFLTYLYLLLKWTSLKQACQV